MVILQDSVKFSDIRKHSDQFFIELEGASSPVTIYKRSKPVAVIMSPTFYNQLKKEPEANWKNAKNSMAFLFKPLAKVEEGFDAVEWVRKDRGY
jgi:PHD/YefM family antitoxin component YafN of YafNO toxin-antitoxin module